MIVNRNPGRSFAFALIMCALLIRAIVPAGYMPSADTDGMIRIELCAGTQGGAVWLARDGTIHPNDPANDDSDDERTCDFTAVSAAIVDTARFAVDPMVPVSHTALRMAAHHMAVGRGLAAPPPPPTGPPFLT